MPGRGPDPVPVRFQQQPGLHHPQPVHLLLQYEDRRTQLVDRHERHVGRGDSINRCVEMVKGGLHDHHTIEQTFDSQPEQTFPF